MELSDADGALTTYLGSDITIEALNTSLCEDLKTGIVQKTRSKLNHEEVPVDKVHETI
jgi:hypothetical protein